MTPLVTDDLPLDVLPIILEGLASRQDYHACTLVNKTFNTIATPLLYRELNSRAIPKSPLHHPASTILKRPELAKYVRHITETGSVYRSLQAGFPHIINDIIRAFALCTKITSFSWIDDSLATHDALLSIISIIRKQEQPLRELTIRTHSDLGTEVWSQLNTLTGIRSISLWCMEGPPRVLQGWSEPLGSTLTHLELGVSVFPCPPDEFLSHLPLLTSLRLKGAPATAILTILTYLPNLKILDTEYLPSLRTAKPPPSEQMPTLTSLTVRTNTADTLGPGKFWRWINGMLQNTGLEKLKLYAFTISNTRYLESSGSRGLGAGAGLVPRMFILDLARTHGTTLKAFDIGSVELTMNDVRCLKTYFEKLEVLVCAIAVPNVSAIQLSISGALNLHTLKMDVHWLPYLSHTIKLSGTLPPPEALPTHPQHPQYIGATFTVQHATDMMLSPENPKLRVIGIGRRQFIGKWVLVEGENKRGIPKFEVSEDTAEDKWNT